jgi:glyoxylase-like metal-dependent hydrolase (beta-lactamase superfamily II)
MQSIADGVYVEDQYLGVTLGVIQQARGLIQIDAPPSPEDSRSWRAALMSLNGGPERVLLILDAHPDRTLGARAMECTVVSQEKTAQVFRARPTTFKAQGTETGADWETIPGLGTVRWAAPEISFGEQMTLHWDETPVVLEHHGGPTSGAMWVILNAQKAVFVGDLVAKSQPPFLAHADLPAWIEGLEELLKPEYRGFTIVSGRGGAVTAAHIKAQLELIKKVHDRLEKLAKRGGSPDAAEKLSETFLGGFRASAAKHKQFAQRLRYGLRHYYARHYRMGSSAEE